MFSSTQGVKVPSEIEALKTNEFLRRRKLRLQQVREQSKDIAKKIRLRAKVEKLKHIVELDAEKERDYVRRQEKLVKQLEDLYAKGVQNVGVGHKQADYVNKENIQPSLDLSKIRGREAGVLLRQEKDRKLLEQKRLLDRKLHAREAANELSREKTKSIPNQLQLKAAETNTAEQTNKKPEAAQDNNNVEIAPSCDEQERREKVDMATQWTYEELPAEWEPRVPKLVLPTEERNSNINLHNQSNIENNPHKRTDLFALSEEMPTSLRGGNTHKTNKEGQPTKSSLTIVSEYLQHRNLRLREPEPPSTSKTDVDDLRSIKQTIQKTRTSRTEGTSPNNACHVHDEQVVPVPMWYPEVGCGFCPHTDQHSVCSKSLQTVTNSQINKIFSAIRPRSCDFQPTPVVRGASPFRRTRMSQTTCCKAKTSNTEKTTKQSTSDSMGVAKKPSVTMYNHSTRNSRDIPCGDSNLVTRVRPDEDAYSLAVKKSASDDVGDVEHEKKLQEMRSKIAMTKQNVEKEYKDTMNFLNSLPKDSRPVKQAFMGEDRQQTLKEIRQRRLQHEFNKIEKECRRKTPQKTNLTDRRSKSKSPVTVHDFEENNMQYSWMPVPECDASMAVHTIPTTSKAGKTNSVKFSKVDSYHEYRSRHKHTPPTKDGESSFTTADASFTETMVADVNADSTSSDSSTEQIQMTSKKRKSVTESDVSDAEKIIIYKIIDTEKEKLKHKAKLVSDSMRSMAGGDKRRNEVKKAQEAKSTSLDKSKIVSEEISEGVYKTVSEKGDNIDSVHFGDETDKHSVDKTQDKTSCRCRPSGKKMPVKSSETPIMQWECGDVIAAPARQVPETNTCHSKQRDSRPLAASSASSFQTAVVDDVAKPPDAGYIKLVDEAGKEAGNFYIGATGFLKNNDYEVIIQLRKKDLVKVGDGHKDEMGTSENLKGESEDRETFKPKTDQQDKEHSPIRQEILRNVATENIQDAQISVTEQDLSKSKSVINENIPPKTKVAKSTCTQTSLNSSQQPPMMFHMSSSTSTAYMSPPDMLLPNFLKSKENILCEEAYEIETREYRHQHYSCKCKKCKHTNRVTVVGRSPTQQSETPPNSERNTKKCKKGHKKHEHNESEQAMKIKECKCWKCKTAKETHSKRSVTMNRKLHKSILQPMNRNKRDRRSATRLNPVIRNYINKLLELNKEGLKAIEVVNLECSSVSTPASSVVNDERNINTKKPSSERKISLKHIQDILKRQILEDCVQNNNINCIFKRQSGSISTESNTDGKIKQSFPRKNKPIHKIKSLNISRKIISKDDHVKITSAPKSSASSSPKGNINSIKHVNSPVQPSTGIESVSSSSSVEYRKAQCKGTSSKTPKKPSLNEDSDCRTKQKDKEYKLKEKTRASDVKKSGSHKKGHRTSSSPSSLVSDTEIESYSYVNKHAQSSRKLRHAEQELDNDIKLMKIEQNKYQNMEKIADLTEKCTQRLSNLAKLLDEVRKSKSSAYSQISSEHSLDNQQKTDRSIPDDEKEPDTNIINEIMAAAPQNSCREAVEKSSVRENFVPLLEGITKPETPHEMSPRPQSASSSENHDLSDDLIIKLRNKPPPALCRMNLKHGQETIVPHELSTVIEVDSPLSLKVKNQSNNGNLSLKSVDDKGDAESINQHHNNSKRDIMTPRKSNEPKPNKTLDTSKMKMMDLKKFNDIMLKPFISIEEYAKQCNLSNLDEGSQIDDVPKSVLQNEEMSSLHSDGSLPDVVAELLKRNIISEPFKFDNQSHINSTTVSSESSLSVFALSTVKRDKKKCKDLFENKENVVESSDSLSISSNPDLENAFKKIGLGWASSTLKKTKERLALSSSSNSSCSSSHNPKQKPSDKQVTPAQTHNTSFKRVNTSIKSSRSQLANTSKNAEQQTSSTKPMTVKEFLRNELANKITFGDQSKRDESEEFISLCETKMPEELKHVSRIAREDRSVDSATNANRARTSTPVQLFKSATYNSSSSSNNASNGLFSNVDDLSSVKVTSSSMRNNSTSDKDDLTIPNCSLRLKKDHSDVSKTE